MNNLSFLIWFAIYALAMIALGWYVSRHQKNGDDFLLGGRSLPMFLTLGSTVGTMVGTGSSVGAVGFGYANGWAGMLYGIGGATGILLVAWLFAPVRKMRFMTMSEEISYYTGGSKIIKNVVALLIFIASIGWLGAHILGGGLYLAWASGIDINVAKVIIALAFVVYVGIGGYSAVVWIDTVQSIVLFLGFILMAVLAVQHVGGWDNIQHAVDPAAQSLFAIDKLGMLPAFLTGPGDRRWRTGHPFLSPADLLGENRFVSTSVIHHYRHSLPVFLLPAGHHRYGGLDHEPQSGKQRFRFLVRHPGTAARGGNGDPGGRDVGEHVLGQLRCHRWSVDHPA